MEALLASLSGDPATHLRFPAVAVFADGLGLGVVGTLGLAPILAAGRAENAFGHQGFPPVFGAPRVCLCQCVPSREP